jgi:hypothetical protein
MIYAGALERESTAGSTFLDELEFRQRPRGQRCLRYSPSGAAQSIPDAVAEQSTADWQTAGKRKTRNKSFSVKNPVIARR